MFEGRNKLTEESENYERIAPSVRERNVQRHKELVAYGILAIATLSRRHKIVDVSSSNVHKWLTP